MRVIDSSSSAIPSLSPEQSRPRSRNPLQVPPPSSPPSSGVFKATSRAYSQSSSQVKSTQTEDSDPTFTPSLQSSQITATSQLHISSTNPQEAEELENLEAAQAFLDDALLHYQPNQLDLESAQVPLSNHAQAHLKLSEEQKKVLKLVVQERKSVFFTGAAGTGKSVLLRRIIYDLRKKYEDGVAVTATTGIAACNIGGRTLHSFGGISPSTYDVRKLLSYIRKSKKSVSRWRQVKVLIVDEVSMMAPELLDVLDEIAQTLRGNKLPFGGIQLVLTGDFFQLPPVDKEKRAYAFDAKCWKTIVHHTILLTQVFRQKDNTFANMLNEMRQGALNDDAKKLFSGLSRSPDVPPGITPTRLFARRDEVQRANQQALDRLEGECFTYNAHDFVYNNAPPTILDAHMAPVELSLKKGAQVMLIKNFDNTLVNGSVGMVIGFMRSDVFGGLPKLNENVGSVKDITSIGPLSLSTCTDLVDEEFIQSLQRSRKSRLAKQMQQTMGEPTYYPIVRFYLQNKTFRDIVVGPETWELTDYNETKLAERRQLPLILAWAISIHKSQGQTLDYVCVDMGSIFEVGQAYVAISRATNLDGLQVLRFNPHKVKIDPRVKAFYESLEQYDELHESNRRKKGQQAVTSYFQQALEQDIDEDDGFGPMEENEPKRARFSELEKFRYNSSENAVLSSMNKVPMDSEIEPVASQHDERLPEQKEFGVPGLFCDGELEPEPPTKMTSGRRHVYDDFFGSDEETDFFGPSQRFGR